MRVDARSTGSRVVLHPGRRSAPTAELALRWQQEPVYDGSFDPRSGLPCGVDRGVARCMVCCRAAPASCRSSASYPGSTDPTCGRDAMPAETCSLAARARGRRHQRCTAVPNGSLLRSAHISTADPWPPSRIAETRHFTLRPRSRLAGPLQQLRAGNSARSRQPLTDRDLPLAAPAPAPRGLPSATRSHRHLLHRQRSPIAIALGTAPNVRKRCATLRRSSCRPEPRPQVAS